MKARCIQEASIAHAPPHVREIWDLLIMKASHRQRPGDLLHRGQVLTSYDEIRNGLSWKVGYRVERYSKWDCEKAMKYLTKEQMITTEKTTRGLIITICKYNYYQNPDNYESHSEDHKKATPEPQPPDTIGKNDKKEKKKYAPSPEVRAAIGYFLQAVEAAKGFRPKIAAKDAALVKSNLKSLSLENIKAQIDFFLSNGKSAEHITLAAALSADTYNLFVAKKAAAKTPLGGLAY